MPIAAPRRVVLSLARPAAPRGVRGWTRTAAAAATALALAACGTDAIVGPHAAPTLDAAPTAAALLEAAPLRTALDVSSAATFVAGPLAFATYEGSGEVVHPDVVTFDGPWHGHRFWAALTPYPNSAERYENPSVYASQDGDRWSAPAAQLNPLATTSRGYLSDPDMVYEPTRGELWMYYREVETRAVRPKARKHYADHVWLTTSTDGTTWARPRQVVADTNRYVVSPSVIRTSATDWRMYAVDAGQGGCAAKSTRVVVRRSTDGLRWTSTAVAGLAQAGYQAWHLDVQYVAARHEYWALLAAYPTGQSCTATSLFLATSPDGARWTTYPTPVLARGAVPQFSAAVYRSTFAHTGSDSVTIWYSGARLVTPATKHQGPVLAWTAAVTHTTGTALLARVADRTGARSLGVVPSAGVTLMPSGEAP